MHFVGKAFERTIRFETPNLDLEKSKKFLRLRSGFKNTITFKKKRETENKNYKEREEIEFEISDLDGMKRILQNLGFTKILIMEKYREKWQGQGVEVVLDKLPMGNYLEVEGSEESIRQMVKTLSLDINKKVISTYWDLWREYAAANNINDQNIIFDNEDRESGK